MQLNTSRLRTIVAKMLLEAVAVGASSLFAFFVRYDCRIAPYHLRDWWQYAPLLIALRVGISLVSTWYRPHWRFTSLPEFWTILRNVVLGSLLFSAFMEAVAPGAWERGTRVLEAFITLNALMLIRLSIRLYVSRRRALSASRNQPSQVLVVGAGTMGERIVRQMLEDHGANLVPVGFVDDDPSKRDRVIHRIPVLGRVEDVARIAEDFGIDQILIAIPSLSGAAVANIVRLCSTSRAELTILPSLPEMVCGSVSAGSIRKISVEDLLERSPIRMDMEAVSAYITGQRVMVTGAGGSIGSELCRQIARLDPASLVLVGQDECALYWIDQELRSDFGFRPDVVVADVRDRNRMDDVFTEHRPTVVFHAAAHKHVPMMEANPGEAVKNNVFGTRSVAELSIRHGVHRFVMISTDKAVNPTSVMGTSKRVAEMVVQSLAQRIELARTGINHLTNWGFDDVPMSSAATIFSSVRFGNVLGSSGSVIPTMQKQIARGGPVTVTHREMTRFFMTIPEAVQLVIQAGGMGSGGEIFVLDMGQPVKILDLAWNLIRLSGFVPDVDIPIKITGMRPGEKLYEEILTAEEGTNSTSHEKICVARATLLDHDALEAKLFRLEHAAHGGDSGTIRALLAEIVPSYHTDTGSGSTPCPMPAADSEAAIPSHRSLHPSAEEE